MNAPSDASLLNKLSKNGLAQFNKEAAAESGSAGNINATQCPKTYALLRAGYFSKM
ncbi:hypothetical protein [uncultured Sphingomonas sp.]|uniref:hypothetical protein n=1 Tax=uncultured Sphingomonas sp. TaxID=158754 RepID=UPI00261E6E26|nr:hypothetical protein [uncultured Sphingomonas sp.]